MDDKIKKSESEETIRQKTEATPGEQTDAYSAPTEENVEAHLIANKSLQT